MLILVCATLGGAVIVHAQGDAKPAPNPTTADPIEAEKSALEAKYAAEAKEKIANETQRVEESMDALFWGIASFVTIAAMLGVFALIKTQSQAKELSRLAAEVDELKANKPRS